VENWLVQNNRPVILDSGCGVGRSTRYLAERYPEHVVIGIDQSVHRLSKAQLDSLPANMLLIRANLVDFWRLAAGSRWQLNKHYLLYPNPWPKTEHLKRRWHGHPVFPDLLALGGQLELRTNWEIYALEMQQALEYSGHSVVVNCFEPGNYLTPFEEKYHRSGQRLFKLTASLT
jgi:tRNA G46 methylase TrmB